MKNGIYINNSKIQFEYFLNALFYCVWIKYCRIASIFKSIIDILFWPIEYLFKKRRIEHAEEIKKQESIIQDFLYNKENGLYIGVAQNIFSTFSFSFILFFTFIIVAFVIKIFDNYNFFIFLIGTIVPCAIIIPPFYKAVYKNNNYLKYFIRFEKKDKQWHKRWGRITTLYCIGCMFMTFVGILAFYYILIYL